MPDMPFIRAVPKNVVKGVQSAPAATPDGKQVAPAPKKPNDLGEDAIRAAEATAEHLHQQVRTKELDREPPTKAPEGQRFAKFLDDGTPRVSPSQIALALDCGEKWRRKYLVGDDDPAGSNMLFGTVFHAIMEHGFRTWQKGKERPDIPDPYLPSQFIAEVGTRLTKRIFTDKDILARLRDAATVNADFFGEEMRDCVTLAWDWVREEQIEPLKVEDRLLLYLDVDNTNVAILGYRDAYAYARKRGKKVTIDWKTSTRAPSKGKRPDGSESYVPKRNYAHASLTYSDASIRNGEAVDEVWVVYATRSSKPKLCVAELIVTEAMLAWSREVSRGAIRLIMGGVFPFNPNSNNCTSNFCGYYTTCPGSAINIESGGGDSGGE